MTPENESVIALGTRIGDYEIVRYLGEGGMGSVYLARHTISNRLDALKLLPEGITEDSEAYARFLREIQILAALKHPHICSLYTAFRSGSHFVMVMEYVEGESLYEVLQGGGLAIPQAVRLGIQVLDALASVHRRNIVHRDIKPTNIVITDEGEAKLVDFGIAKSEALTRLTQPNMILGALPWMSPERIGGKALDGRSDLYALGVVLYEAATGRLPFSGGLETLVLQHLNAQPDPPRQVNPRIPESLNHVILRALEKDPGARYQNAEEFKTALEVVLREIRLPPQAAATQPLAPLDLGNGVEMEFVYIPAGSFWMGCSPGDTECYHYEKPRRQVEITKPFEMGKYEVTQAEWKAVMGSNPSEFKGPRRPVEQVSWQDVQEFMKRLNARNDGYRYRLPSEAEWEYAGRAGETGKYYGEIDAIGWYLENRSSGTHSVGGKQPNGWGLYDMLGNVWEWCEDWYDERYYQVGENRDPKGPGSGEERVVRGGSSFNGMGFLRLSDRVWFAPSDRYSVIGFRCVREAN